MRTNRNATLTTRGAVSSAALGMAAIMLLVACGSGAQPTESSGASQAIASSPSSSAAPSSATPSRTAAAPDAGPIPARGATLVGPTGLLFDAAGNLYISGCSSATSHIYRVDPRGMLTTIAGAGLTAFAGDGGPATAATLDCPVGMAFGPDGALYFADHASNRVRRVDAAGVITTVVGSGPAGVDAGSFSGDGGPATAAMLQEPWSIAFDRAGNMYISDRDNFRVRRVDLDGVITTVAGTGNVAYDVEGGLAAEAGLCPRGVAVDPADNLVIADPCTNTVRKVDRHGAMTTIVGTGKSGFSGDGGPATAALVDAPDFPVFDAAGDMLIRAGPRVRRIDRAGIITTIAGNGKVGVPEEGTVAVDAPLPDAYGVAVDLGGDVYVADGTTAVFRIDRNGDITVFAGSP